MLTWAAIFERLDDIEMAIRPRGIMAGAIETSRGDRTGVEAIRGDAMALEVADRVGQSLSNLSAERLNFL